MKVILLKDIPGLGKRGEVKNVSGGYGRNFLLPQGSVALATESQISELNQKKAQETAQLLRDKAKFEKIKETIEKIDLNIPIKLGEKGQAFGSVTVTKILASLKKSGIDLEKENVILEESIKKLGTHKIKIKLPQEIEAELSVRVEKEA